MLSLKPLSLIAALASFPAFAETNGCVLLPSAGFGEFDPKIVGALASANGWTIGSWNDFNEARMAAQNDCAEKFESDDEVDACVQKTRNEFPAQFKLRQGTRGSMVEVAPLSSLKKVDRNLLTTIQFHDFGTGARSEWKFGLAETCLLEILEAKARKELPKSLRNGAELVREWMDKRCSGEEEDRNGLEFCRINLAHTQALEEALKDALERLGKCP